MNSNTIIIRADAQVKQYWRDLWRYRELFYFLTWKDVLVRYKQTIAGVAWAWVRPLLSIIIMTGIFRNIGNFSSGSAPYPLMLCTGLLPWQFFATSLSESGNSLVANSNLISKIYFPRLIVPCSSVVTALFDFFISLGVLVLMMIYYQFLPTWRVVFLPLFILLACGAALGGGLWVSTLTVRYRDFRVIVPFVIQFGYFLSPLIYKTESVPAKWRLLYSANPMVGVIDGFRWAILGGDFQLSIPGLAISVLLVVVVLTSGIWYFRKTERTFADII